MSPIVLVVEHDPAERMKLGRWLEEAGFDALMCPGPSEPDYDCIASTRHRCPLAIDADAVVIDLRLASDEGMRGLPGCQVLLYYVEAGMQVVALVGPDDAVAPRQDDQISLLERPPRRDELLAAVGRAVATRRRSA